MKYIVILVPARHVPAIALAQARRAGRLRLRRGGRVFVTLWLN